MWRHRGRSWPVLSVRGREQEAGGGAQKAISVREIKAIRMTDAVKFEFEVVTSNHSYKFRGSDKTNAFQWVNGLQQLHNRTGLGDCLGFAECAFAGDCHPVNGSNPAVSAAGEE